MHIGGGYNHKMACAHQIVWIENKQKKKKNECIIIDIRYTGRRIFCALSHFVETGTEKLTKKALNKYIWAHHTQCFLHRATNKKHANQKEEWNKNYGTLNNEKLLLQSIVLLRSVTLGKQRRSTNLHKTTRYSFPAISAVHIFIL